MLRHSSSSQRGQSLLEYAVILALVISGILIGGPLLMNAVNSHFRLLDDATQDSLTEQPTEAGVDDAPVEDPTCSCEEWKPVTGPEGCGINADCNAQSRKHTRKCSSPECDTEEKCVSDPDCCSTLVDMGCGTLLPDGSTTLLDECPGRTTSDLIKIQNELSPSGTYKGTCTDKTSKDTQQCAIGERKVRMECGTDPEATTETQNVFYACKTEEHCLPNCSPYLLTNAIDCHSKTDQNNTPRSDLISEVVKRKTLPSSSLKPTRSVKVFNTVDTVFDISAVQLPYAFVRSGSDCTADRYCEASCEQDPSDPTKIYLPSSDGTICKPAFCQPTARSSFVANPNEFDSGSLPYTTNFAVTILAGQHYIFACLDKDGGIEELQGTAELLGDASACPAANKRTLNGNSYCISDPITTPIIGDTEVFCSKPASQLYLRVWGGSPGAQGYSRLIYDKCTAYTPSQKMALSNNAISACGTKMKVVTDPNVYRDNCNDTGEWLAYMPSPNYFLGCYKPDCTGSSCYFVYCE
jgi:Flp pilus assembly pilin Flp